VATVQVPTTPVGDQRLLAWARGLGEPVAWGVEGTGSYGAALARFLAAQGQVVVEVNRPDRAARRRHGKSDPVDAQAAAKAVQAGDATVVPKAGTGQVEMIRSLRVARQTAMRARTQTSNALKGLLVTAPAELGEQLRGMSVTRLVRAAAGQEPGPITSPLAVAMLALHPGPPSPGPVGRDRLPHQRAGPAGRHSGAQAGGAVRRRPRQRRRAAGRRRRQPRPAAQRRLLLDAVRLLADPGLLGKTTRQRRNRGGDRQANAALHRIVVVRLCHDQQTKDYMARRLTEGKTKKEIIRCLKRYVAREGFAVLNQLGQDTLTATA
jgi:transposase